jgi:hypothetical protein
MATAAAPTFLFPKGASGGNASKRSKARPDAWKLARNYGTINVIWLYTQLLQLTLIYPLHRSDGQRLSSNRRIHRPFLSGSIFVNTKFSPGSDEDCSTRSKMPSIKSDG